MPRKKSSSSSTSPTRPLKKLKIDTNEPETSTLPLQPANKNNTEHDPNMRVTRAKLAMERPVSAEIGASRSSPRKGGGYSMSTRKGDTPSKTSNSEELKVTPLEGRQPPSTDSDSAAATRKRRGSTTVASEDKKKKSEDDNKKEASEDGNTNDVFVKTMSPVSVKVSADLSPIVRLSSKLPPVKSGSDIGTSGGLGASDMPEIPPNISPHAASHSQPGLPSNLPSKDEDPLLTRQLVYSLRAKELSSPTFSIMTYNILAECWRTKCDYSYTCESYLVMPYRHIRIMQEISAYQPDVICMQEVESQYYYATLLPHLQRQGYEGVFQKKYDDDVPEGEATFYKTSQFRLVKTHPVSFFQCALKDIEKLECSVEVKESLTKHLLPRKDSCLLLTHLMHIPSNKPVLLGNTHICWTWFKDIDLPCMQVGYAFKETMALSSKDNLPFILCGDFNTRITDPAYQLAAEGYLNDESIKTLQDLKTIETSDGSKRTLVDTLWSSFQHPARCTVSAYKHVLAEEPKVSSRNMLMEAGVDYMWSSQLEPTAVLPVNVFPQKLPNILYPSDHLSLLAHYAFTDQPQ